jgi:oligoribonuclease NrnB/cAMP/cGMP phosphodiesterase (DHH superfamily)
MYHGNCPDGFGSALVAWLIYGDNATYTPVYHNRPIPEIESRQLCMIDFCYNLEQMQEIAKKVDKLTLIDHHQGVAPVAEKLKELSNVEVFFDTKNSGSVLAWKYFNPGKEVPKLLQFIEDRDCHFNRLEDAKPGLMWLDTQPFEFSLWKTFLNFSDETWQKVIDYNQPMVNKFNSMIKRAAKQSVKTTLAGYPAALCFGTEETASDIATEMAQAVKGIGIVFVAQTNGTIKASIRTSQEINLIPIAQKLGGNGHPYAAAFPCTPEKMAYAMQGNDLFYYEDFNKAA